MGERNDDAEGFRACFPINAASDSYQFAPRRGEPFLVRFPGLFDGIKSDIWQRYQLAMMYIDLRLRMTTHPATEEELRDIGSRAAGFGMLGDQTYIEIENMTALPETTSPNTYPPLFELGPLQDKD
jgi:hypothetical protein